jgi:hypothetical protein
MYDPFSTRIISPEPEKQPPASAMIHLRGIQINLRGKFGRVRHGKKLSYALVEGIGRKVIVKINGVGLLAPGLVTNFNRQTMVISIRPCKAG